MILLVFMAIAFSFLARDEGLRDIPRIEKELKEARAEITRLKKANKNLERDLEKARNDLDALKRFLKRIGFNDKTLTPEGPTIYVPGFGDYILDKKAGKAPGRPMCRLAATYLLTVTLLPDFKVKPERAWAEVDEASLSGYRGLEVLGSGMPMSLAEFELAARQLQADVKQGAEDCVFAVSVRRATKDADEFDKELRVVERYFYVRRM
jgi:hypothetical protein